MNDYLSLLPATLQWASQVLDSISPIPWPLWIGMWLPLYLGVLTLMVWILRGAVWPVRCAYPKTQRGGPCLKWVAGEWRRCGYHDRPVQYAYGHRVRPEVRRWQTLTRNNKIVDVEVSGIGVFRTRPVGGTLLYQNGYVRTPSDAAGLLPDKLRTAYRRIRRMSLRLPGEGGDDTEPDEIADANRGSVDTAVNLTSVVQATRFATINLTVALAFSIVAVFFSGQVQSILQWLATLGFVLAWAGSYAGVFQGRVDWRAGAALKALRWWALIFVPVAVANLFFAATNTPPV